MPQFLSYLLILLFIQQNLLAQTPSIQWQRCLGGSSSDVAYNPSIRPTVDGGYILLSSTSSIDGDVVGNHGGGDLWIVKLSNTGTTQWQHCLGGSNIDIADNLSILPTADGGYVLTGSISSRNGDVVGNHGGGDIWVVKLGSTGTIQWQRYLGGSNYEYGSSILPTADGGYILAAYTASFDGDVVGNHGSSDLWVVKLSSTGTTQWQRCLGGSGYDVANDGYNYASSLQLTADGGYILSGYTYSTDGDVSGNHGGGDIWVVKLGSTGATQWQRCLGGSSYEYTAFIRPTSDGGYILSGYTYSTDGNVVGNHGGGDIWIVKLSSTGTIQWQRCLGGSSDDIANNPSIQPTADGGYVLTGSTASSDGDVLGNHGGGDSWVIKLSSTGTIQWQRCLGGSLAEYSSSILLTADGGYMLAGSTASSDGDVVGNHGGSDLWIVKLGSTGTIQWQRCFGGSLTDANPSIQLNADGSYVLAGSTISNDGDVSGSHGSSDIWVVKLGISIQHFHQLPQSLSFQTRQLLTENKNFKLCADGSEASVFKLSGGGQDYSQAIIKIPGTATSETGSFSVIQRNRDSLSVRYKHPDYLSTPGVSTTLVATLYSTSTSTAALTAFTITAYRAPVLMVHGVWSGPASFSAMENQLIASNLYASDLVKRVDYSSTAGRHFSDNVPILEKAIDDLIRSIRTGGIASGKVDYVGHSTGGILARLHIQKQTYPNDIRRLITLNTPHSGSQIGNLFSDPSLKKALDIACPTVFSIAFPAILCGGGAIDDLRVDGPVILQDLNGANVNAHVVQAHSIATTASLPTLPDGFNKQNKSTLMDFFLATDPLMTFNGANDLVVPEISQHGGLSGDCTTLINDQMHIGSPANKQVIDRVKALLTTTPSSTSFCQYVNPPRLSYSADSGALPTQTTRTGSITIVSPVRGKVLSANALLAITVVGKELTEIKTMVDFNEDTVYLARRSGAQATYTVVSDGRFPGKKYITAIGKTPTGDYIADTTFFYVDNTLPESQCNSIQSGNWSTATTWSCGHEPTVNDIVTINPGHIITVSTTTAQAQFIYNRGMILYSIPGAKLSIKGSG